MSCLYYITEYFILGDFIISNFPPKMCTVFMLFYNKQSSLLCCRSIVIFFPLKKSIHNQLKAFFQSITCKL